MPTIKAIETVDECLGKIVDLIVSKGGTVIITADHGNADEVVTLEGDPMTAHTTNPVPVIITKNQVALPTISYLTEQGAKVILASHLGRPKGQVVEELRLAPVAERLSELSGKDVQKAEEAYGESVQSIIDNMGNGEILLLENVRFYPGEEKNDPELAKSFAALADVYVNDAFGAAHRAHASTEGIAHHLPAVAGLLMGTIRDSFFI